MQPTHALRVMGIGDIIDESVRLLRNNFVAFVAIAAVALVPVGIISTVLSIAMLHLASSGTSGAVAGASLDPRPLPTVLIAASLVALIPAALLTVLCNAALAVAISDTYLGRHARLGSSYSIALGRFGILLLSGALAILCLTLMWLAVAVVGVGVAAMLSRIGAGSAVLGVVLAIALFCLFLRLIIGWVLVPQVIVLEKVGAIAAFRRSAALIAGFRWKAAGVLLVSSLLLLVLQEIPVMMARTGMQALHVDASVIALVDNLIQLVFNVVLSPVPLAATTLLFYDLKIRKEAFDLEVLAGQLGAQQSALLP